MMFIGISYFKKPTNIYAYDSYEPKKNRDFLTENRMLIQCYSCAGTLCLMTLWVILDLLTENISSQPLQYLVLTIIAVISGLYFVTINIKIFKRPQERHEKQAPENMVNDLHKPF